MNMTPAKDQCELCFPDARLLCVEELVWNWLSFPPCSLSCAKTRRYTVKQLRFLKYILHVYTHILSVICCWRWVNTDPQVAIIRGTPFNQWSVILFSFTLLCMLFTNLQSHLFFIYISNLFIFQREFVNFKILFIAGNEKETIRQCAYLWPLKSNWSFLLLEIPSLQFHSSSQWTTCRMCSSTETLLMKQVRDRASTSINASWL